MTYLKRTLEVVGILMAVCWVIFIYSCGIIGVYRLMGEAGAPGWIAPVLTNLPGLVVIGYVIFAYITRDTKPEAP